MKKYFVRFINLDTLVIVEFVRFSSNANAVRRYVLGNTLRRGLREKGERWDLSIWDLSWRLAQGLPEFPAEEDF